MHVHARVGGVPVEMLCAGEYLVVGECGASRTIAIEPVQDTQRLSELAKPVEMPCLRCHTHSSSCSSKACPD